MEIATKFKVFFSRWGKRIVDKDERRNYLAAEGLKLIVITIYVLVSIALFIEASVRYHRIMKDSEYCENNPDRCNQTTAWIVIARGFGQLLNLNCALILVPTMRSVLSLARAVKLHVIIPLDKNIVFHRYLAYITAVYGVLHAVAHYANYGCCYDLYGTYSRPLEPSWADKYGITGHIISFCMVLMYSASEHGYRRSNNFTVFWYTHHLFIIFFAALLIHGKNFWKWFLIPGTLYLVERLLRIVRGNSKTIVKKVHALPSNVIWLEVEKSGFAYKAGQYCFVNCPLLSKHEWHPFTISSAPEEETLQFHIRCVGDWTRALRDLLNPTRNSTIVIDKPTGPDGKTHILRVDGPFGAPAEHVFDYPYIMLIAAGIGVTPYASILKHILHRKKTDDTLKTKKVYFYWINRDQGSWEWFSDLLTQLETEYPDFIEVHTFMTGPMKIDDIRFVIYTSDEYKTAERPANEQETINMNPTARAMFPYDPECSDEIELQEDDTLEITYRDPSGWWEGTNQRTKESGLFPGEFVTLVDSVTKMQSSTHRHYGRPVWKDLFSDVRQQVEQYEPESQTKKRPRVGVFFCGPPVLSKQLYKFSVAESKVGRPLFQFSKENF
eukprot:gb/GECH01006356.1/.p1 GENE.gb/GECH01006356.1/~~gb/GECH01006356.1/.p1  ORF type:complete len:609 (+),score=143.17 gb/GECH01006356.1/:1-1827(+)